MRQFGFRRRRRLSPVILTLSLGLNLFLAGWAASDYFLGPRPQLQPVRNAEIIASDIATILPPNDAGLLRQTIANRKPDFDRARTSYYLALDYLRGTMSAKEFDPTAFQGAMRAVRESRQAERTIFVDSLTAAIVKMSPEGRQAFVDKHLGGGLQDRADEHK